MLLCADAALCLLCVWLTSAVFVIVQNKMGALTVKTKAPLGALPSDPLFKYYVPQALGYTPIPGITGRLGQSWAALLTHLHGEGARTTLHKYRGECAWLPGCAMRCLLCCLADLPLFAPYGAGPIKDFVRDAGIAGKCSVKFIVAGSEFCREVAPGVCGMQVISATASLRNGGEVSMGCNTTCAWLSMLSPAAMTDLVNT